ncbi:bifunctional GNAT family N-acetyltransferase/nucleoside triphosphate pyrophosphohydrolase family protein [Actinomyces minihominis]|uniref:bifunctional GNAT family N-acetyltransferase/nucleoside triphosphate pyrophosphohydrolase family protein n=1 Tax=Actinomyces minihominis TaxID=2002838 RepID=UPI00101AE4E7|nr:bifunctional GNAT family N-acetyltransferase/nucleoside triphosphate pyrophosphohydrolase family protein [Actinomyces minihominis]
MSAQNQLPTEYEGVQIPAELAHLVVLLSERLVLAPVLPADTERVYTAAQSERFKRWLPWAAGRYTEEMAAEFTGTFVPSSWASGQPVWGIYPVQDDGSKGQLAGVIDLRISGTDREVGFWIHGDSEGNGYMTEACRLVLRAAFEQLGVARVLHIAEVGNEASRRIARNCGFIPEGVRRVEDKKGHIVSQWQSAIVKSDWNRLVGDIDMAGFPAVPPAEVLPGDRPGDLVAEFHAVYGMPNRVEDGQEATLDFDRLQMRMSLIEEEVTELVEAVYGPRAGEILSDTFANLPDEGVRDVVEAADALADLTYVIYGMALEAGIDLDRVLAEVHSSNLSKLMPDGSVKRREDGKILKGPNFREPKIAEVLGTIEDGPEPDVENNQIED